jgi:hypothetical protein
MIRSRPKSPAKAIRAHCLECCGQYANEVQRCGLLDCPLHPFRFGKNPFTKRTLSDDQKAAMRERMQSLAEKKRAKTDSGGTPCSTPPSPS